jgi:hypothetical protein
MVRPTECIYVSCESRNLSPIIYVQLNVNYATHTECNANCATEITLLTTYKITSVWNHLCQQIKVLITNKLKRTV